MFEHSKRRIHAYIVNTLRLYTLELQTVAHLMKSITPHSNHTFANAY